MSEYTRNGKTEAANLLLPSCIVLRCYWEYDKAIPSRQLAGSAAREAFVGLIIPIKLSWIGRLLFVLQVQNAFERHRDCKHGYMLEILLLEERPQLKPQQGCI